MNKQLSAKRIAIAGGSGFHGLSTAEAFMSAGAEVTIVSRSLSKAIGAWRHVVWDGRTLGDWTQVLYELPRNRKSCRAYGELHQDAESRSFRPHHVRRHTLAKRFESANA